MTTQSCYWSPLFHKSMADGAKVVDCPAGADSDCFDHESQLFTVNNLFNILQQTSVNAIMAVGMTLVILTSGIDLSVGSLLALTGAVAASIVGLEVNALVAIAAALALGAAIGAVTGVIVAKGRVQAFIATGDDVAPARGDDGLHQR